jgi:hypothetical protein
MLGKDMPLPYQDTVPKTDARPFEKEELRDV